MTPTDQMEQQILHRLGEIRGEVKCMTTMLASFEQSMNQRFSDAESLTQERFRNAGQRVGDAEKMIRELQASRENMQAALDNLRVRMALLAGASGGVTAGAVELLMRGVG